MREALPSLVALACFAPALIASDFIRDDVYFIERNPLLGSLRGLAELWTTGYCEAVYGAAALVSEYRPVLMLSYFLDTWLLGMRPGPLHATNFLLHAANAWLLRRLLTRWLDGRAAWIAALFFAVMPVHAEAVAGLVNRSELLATCFSLSAWLLLGDAQPRARQAVLGVAAFGVGLLSKESAIAFPAILAIDDWCSGRLPPSGRRRWVWAGMAAVTLAYLGVRAWLLPEPFKGGVPYFEGQGPLARLLTVARFWGVWYVVPAAVGAPIAYDFARPWVADSTAADALAWLCLLGWAALALAGCRALKARRSWGVWCWVPFLWLAPTSHVFFELDTLGAQRLFYFPSIAVAVALAWLLGRRAGAAWSAVLAAWLVGLAGQSVRAAGDWTSNLRYYEAAVRRNPVSAGARLGLGAALLARGRRAEAASQFEHAARLKPGDWGPHYNLGKLLWEEGRRDEGRRLLERAAALEAGAADVWSQLALDAEARGDRKAAARHYRRALKARPRDKVARYNLGLLYWNSGRRELARRELGEFLELYPRDPDADTVRALLGSR